MSLILITEEGEERGVATERARVDQEVGAGDQWREESLTSHYRRPRLVC